MALLTALDIDEESSVWRDLGFEVSDTAVWVSGVAHRLAASPTAPDGPTPLAGPSVRSWSLWGVTAPSGPRDVDGLPTVVVDDPAEDPGAPAHPNGVTGLDHLVVSTPDLDRTLAALDGIGLQLLRVRETPSVRQGFYRLGPVILEVVGGAQPSGDGPARFLGLAWTCADLDATAAWLGSRLHPAKDAVQEGRRIATLDKAAGSRVSMAFMSPARAR